MAQNEAPTNHNHDGRDLHDLRLNVAHLLKGPVGTRQRVRLAAPRMELGEQREARDLAGDLRLTKLDRGLLATGPVSASVELTCMRCLEEYLQPIAFELEEEFRPAIDITSGTPLRPRDGDDDTDYLPIGDDHVLDLSEAFRQAIWLATPMVPLCREDCPGISVPELVRPTQEEGAPTVDDRLAVLADLLQAESVQRRSPRQRRR